MSGQGTKPIPAVVIRGICLLSILLMLFAPISLAVAAWDWDWRWILTGVISGVVGLFIGWVVTRGGKRSPTAAPPLDPR